MQARFYLPGWGRFASPDPGRDQHFEQTQSWNIYSYVQNNPVQNIDPTGMVAYRKLTVDGWVVRGNVWSTTDNYSKTSTNSTQTNSLSKTLTNFNPSKMSDAGKTDINKKNLSALIYSLSGELINGSTGLRAQIGSDVPVTFRAGTPKDAYGDTRNDGNGYTITIDVNALAGSLHALGAVVAHELQHVLTEIQGGGADAMSAANWHSQGMMEQVSHLQQRCENSNSPRDKAIFEQALMEYMWNNPVETPSYRRQSEYLQSVGEL